MKAMRAPVKEFAEAIIAAGYRAPPPEEEYEEPAPPPPPSPTRPLTRVYGPDTED